MTKIQRPHLTRGTRLQVGHVFDSLSAVAAGINTITPDRMQKKKAAFDIVWNLPAAQGVWLARKTATEEAELMLPIIFPPLQDEWLGFRHSSADTPRGRITSMWLGWDQRDESAAIDGIGTVTPGFLNFNAALTEAAYTVNARILSKLTRGTATNYTGVPDTIHAQMTVPGLAVMDGVSRTNPIRVQTNIDINPWRTYVVMVKASNIDPSLCLSSLTVGIRVEYPLIPRDAAPTNVEVQNMPVAHLGARTPGNITLSVPAVGSTIEADTADGVQTNIEAIDQVLVEGVSGGYDRNGEAMVQSQIQADAGYDIIHVPMFSGIFATGLATHLAALPYASAAAPFIKPCMSRGLIPVTFPFVLHRVLLVLDFAGPPDATTYLGVAGSWKLPALATTHFQCGISLGQFIRSDNARYQDIAYLDIPADEINDTVPNAQLIDAVRHQSDSTMSEPPPASMPSHWIFEVPLHYPAGSPSTKSYHDTGNPIWCGRSWSPTQARTQVANGVGGVLINPSTNGGEHVIECRLHFGNAAVGLNDEGTNPANPLPIWVGGTGHHIYLIGKRHLAGEY